MQELFSFPQGIKAVMEVGFEEADYNTDDARSILSKAVKNNRTPNGYNYRFSGDQAKIETALDNSSLIFEILVGQTAEEAESLFPFGLQSRIKDLIRVNKAAAVIYELKKNNRVDLLWKIYPFFNTLAAAAVPKNIYGLSAISVGLAAEISAEMYTRRYDTMQFLKFLKITDQQIHMNLVYSLSNELNNPNSTASNVLARILTESNQENNLT